MPTSQCRDVANTYKVENIALFATVDLESVLDYTIINKLRLFKIKI
jgi:hypothetical protein